MDKWTERRWEGREGGRKGNEMTFEPVKSGSNMASYWADQEGHYSIFRRLIWEHWRWMVLIYGAQTFKWTTGRAAPPRVFCLTGTVVEMSTCYQFFLLIRQRHFSFF